MASSAVDSVIHGFLFSTDEMREIFSDKSWAQKWLDTEAALAKAQGELGVIPQEKADIINKYADANLLDLPSIGEFYTSSSTIVPLLKAFKKVLPDNAGEFVHWGATSQDIVDTQALPYACKEVPQHRSGRPYACGACHSDYVRLQSCRLGRRARPRH